MIRFLLTRDYRHTLTAVRKSSRRHKIGLVNYEDLTTARRLRPATYIFADLDRLSYWSLEFASRLFLELKDAGFRVLNNPARVKQRYALLRSLHEAGLNDFNAYRAEELPSAIRFPVFLRKAQGHGTPLSDLLHTRAAVEDAIGAAVATGLPPEHLIVIEFAGEPVREGLYRKLSAFRIGPAIVPYLCGHDTHWLVKTGQLGIAGEDLYRDELKLLQTNPYSDYLQKVFSVAEIEYGRADFGFYKGRIQVFEINTNPFLAAFSPHPSVFRVQSMRLAWEKYMNALTAIDSGPGQPIVLTREDAGRGGRDASGRSRP